MSFRVHKTCHISPKWSPRQHKNQLATHQNGLSCTKLGCLICIMNEPESSMRRSRLAKYFSQLHHTQDDDDDLIIVSLNCLWSIALSKPDDPEFPSLGIFECMAKHINKCIQDREWLSRGKNIYVPYYAAHIIGSYTMNKEKLADMAVKSRVIPPLMELLRGKISWVEQRVAVRALGHIASHIGCLFEAISGDEEEEMINLAMKISCTCFDTVYTQFLSLKSEERVRYHRDLIMGSRGMEMEDKKAEEWAAQLQCWSLYLLNCFAIRRSSCAVNLICQKDFLEELCGMWGGGHLQLENTHSFSGVCLIRSVCLTKEGRTRVANSNVVLERLCNLSRSSDEWQRKAIDSILLLVQDQETRARVLHLVAPFMADLVELKITKGSSRRRRCLNVGDAITRLLLCDYGRIIKNGEMVLMKKKKKDDRAAIEEVWSLKVERRPKEEMMSEEELRDRKVKVGRLKREGNEKFWRGEVEEAAVKFTEALDLCPLKMKKERIVLYSNRAQCYLVLREAESAISDTTRALCLSSANPPPHIKSLWRRCQAYDMLGMPRESLMDCLMFIKFKNRSHFRVPQYAVRMLNKQIAAAATAANPFGRRFSFGQPPKLGQSEKD